VDIPLLLGSRPRRLAAISHQPPTFLTATLRLNHNWATSAHYIAPARTAKKMSFIIAHSLIARETRRQSGSIATAVVLLPVYTAVTWQWVHMSQYSTDIQ
jgi:hypothetical protein